MHNSFKVYSLLINFDSKISKFTKECKNYFKMKG